MIPKPISHRDAEYLAFVRRRPCVVTGVEGDSVVAHHVRCLGGGGMGLKPSDYMCLPLDTIEHSRLHAFGEERYWRAKGISPGELIRFHLLIFLATINLGQYDKVIDLVALERA